MGKLGSQAAINRHSKTPTRLPLQVQGCVKLPMRHAGLASAAIIAFGLAACSHPAPVAVVLPPPPSPVGHPYATLAQVPPTTRRMTPEQIQDVQQAFNVIALKSALMVAALTCGQQTQYDQFMNTFQPHILAEQHVMDAYFKKMGGYYGQSKEDDFVTLQANNQSVGGIGQGAVFCLNNSAEFKQVLAMKTDSDLDNLVTAASPDPGQPFADVMVASSYSGHSYHSHHYTSLHYASTHSTKPSYVAHPQAAHPVQTATATAPATVKPVSVATADAQ